MKENKPMPRALQRLLKEFGIVGDVRKEAEGKGWSEYILAPTKAVRARDVVSLSNDLERIMGLPSVRIAVVFGQNAFSFKLYSKPLAVCDVVLKDVSPDLYKKAVAVVREHKKASISFIQRHLEIGYNRASTIMDRMEKDGLVSEADHVGKREIYI